MTPLFSITAALLAPHADCRLDGGAAVSTGTYTGGGTATVTWVTTELQLVLTTINVNRWSRRHDWTNYCSGHYQPSVLQLVTALSMYAVEKTRLLLIM